MAVKRAMLGMDAGLVGPGERVCVAVSGGADSVALLCELVELNGRREPLGVVLSAVHVHHGLRGAEADADEAFVRELCDRLGVPLVVERVDVAGRQAEEREGLEEAARELRYGVFRGLMEAGKADVVATAHTLDDQAETVVMKLLRGAWTEGIGGIAPVVVEGPGSKAQGPGERRIIRPMLGVRRAEVEAYLEARGQVWREDATNRDTALTRNRVRHELMPVLRGFNPGVDGALARLAEIAREEEAFWQAEVGRVLPQVMLPGRPVRGGGRAVSTAAGSKSCAVEVERLRGMAPALRRRVLRAAARSLGCRISAEETAKMLMLAGLPPQAAGGPGGTGMSRGQASGGRVGARLELGGGLRVERTARELQLAVVSGAFVAREKGSKTGGAAPGGE